MKTLYAAALALSVLTPALANAGTLYDPNAGSNDQRFIASGVFDDAQLAAAHTAAMKVYTGVLRMFGSAFDSDVRGADGVSWAAANHPVAAKADAQKYAGNGQAGASVSHVYDPNAGSNDPRFQRVISYNSGNAAAAKRDAAAYAAAQQVAAGSTSSALIGTHDATTAGARIVTHYDPNAGSNDDRFPSVVVLGQ